MANRDTRLLYSLQLPQNIYAKLTKKANKNKRKSNIDMYEFEFTIRFKVDYANGNGIYNEDKCIVELKGSLIENYLTLPVNILENLNVFELYAHSNRRNTILENEIEQLRKHMDNARVYSEF